MTFIEEAVLQQMKPIIQEWSKPRMYELRENGWINRVIKDDDDVHNCPVCGETKPKTSPCYWCMYGQPSESIQETVVEHRKKNRRNTFNFLTPEALLDLVMAEKKEYGTVDLRITNMDTWYTISEETRTKLEALHTDNKKELSKRSTLRIGHRLKTYIPCVITYVSGGYFEGSMFMNPDPEWVSTWDRSKIYVERKNIPNWLMELQNLEIVELI